MNPWSEASQEKTREVLEGLIYYPRDGKLWFKHIDHTFACMNDIDVIQRRYAMHTPKGDPIKEFSSIDDILTGGWVVD